MDQDIYAANLIDHSMLAHAVDIAQSQRERFDALQAMYRGLWPFLKTLPRHQWAMDPNSVNWTRLFTPIELAVWGDIRSEGAVLYPQHPVGNYFVDFGHPLARVAIECDGKRWHTDKARDAQRQAAIEARGWTVYRLTGQQCLTASREVFDDDGCEAPTLDFAASLLRDVCKEHGLSQRHARQAA